MRAELERDGFVVLEDVLPLELRGRLLEAVDRVYEDERVAGRVASDGSLHLLDFLHREPAFLDLLDVPDRGNFTVIPGSHRQNTLARPDGARGAVPVLARPGAAVVFDRRLWHARGENTSTLTRKALFVGYTYRWIRPRENGYRNGIGAERLTPLRRQLLGHATSGLGYWLPTEEETPLKAWLRDRGLLDLALPSHR